MSESVDDEFIKIALEFSSSSEASLILQTENGSKLYLGGMNSSLEKFMSENNITHVINTAKGIENIWIKWGKDVKQYFEKKNIKSYNIQF
jgi:hypothetical protein